jgi:ribonuclease Z
MTFEVYILGSSSATPIYQRHPTAQILNIHEKLFLVDCGEGTLIQLNRYHIRFHRINHIFISHLHGDHYLGLMGLLSTMHLQGRSDDLHVYSQPELKEMIDIQMLHSQTQLRYKIVWHFLDSKIPAKIYEDDDLEVFTIILSHRIPCTGFLFKEKQKLRKLIREQLIHFNIPVHAYSGLKNGKDYRDEKGNVISNEELTTDPRSPRTYAFCSDTIYDETLVPILKNIDLLYHESTFLSDKADRAKETYHSTAAQAATIAKMAEVKRLIIGHFSARYKNLYPLLEEARTVFENTTLAVEGDRFTIE